MYDVLPVVFLSGLILGVSMELGKIVVRIFIVFLVRPKKTPLWPWTDHYE